jgi:pilus assembly protein CpaB
MVFLVLAIIIAGATAFLARAWLQAEWEAMQLQANQQRSAQPVTPTLQVLVARNAVRTGQIVKPDDLRWQVWPQGNLQPTYIVEGTRQLSDFVGAVARRPLAAGEPVIEGRLMQAGTHGFMAAVLQPGMRAVSVPVTPTSAVSGFIYAGDRVDVLLTHVLLNKQQVQRNATETILRNARVIAMDQKLDSSPADKPDIAKTATLELTPKQSEIVTLAQKMGDLSLVLRSLQESGDTAPDPTITENAPAMPGDSYTQDGQVSRLINSAPPPPAEPAPSLVILRGGTSSKQEVDGQPAGDSSKAVPSVATPGTPRGSRQ